MAIDSPTLSLHLFNLNPSFQAQDNFHDFLQAHISSTLLYPIPVLLQKRVHTPISVSLLTIYTLLCATRFYFSHFLQNAPGWCDCPWGGKSSGLFPVLILTSVSDTADHFLTVLLPCTPKHYTVKVLLFFWQFLLPSPKWRCVLCPPISPSSLLQGFKQGSKWRLLSLYL